MLFKNKQIESFDRLLLKISGMRDAWEYEIICRGEKSEVAAYTLCFSKGEDCRRLDNSASVDTKVILGLLNDCRILKWDGFSGANPRGVRDGYMFTLKAVVNGDRNIYACGSNNYPRHYHELIKGITDMLQGG